MPSLCSSHPLSRPFFTFLIFLVVENTLLNDEMSNSRPNYHHGGRYNYKEQPPFFLTLHPPPNPLRPTSPLPQPHYYLRRRQSRSIPNRLTTEFRPRLHHPCHSPIFLIPPLLCLAPIPLRPMLVSTLPPLTRTLQLRLTRPPTARAYQVIRLLNPLGLLPKLHSFIVSHLLLHPLWLLRISRPFIITLLPTLLQHVHYTLLVLLHLSYAHPHQSILLPIQYALLVLLTNLPFVLLQMVLQASRTMSEMTMVIPRLSHAFRLPRLLVPATYPHWRPFYVITMCKRSKYWRICPRNSLQFWRHSPLHWNHLPLIPSRARPEKRKG